MRKLGLLPCLLLVAAAPASPDAKLKEIIAPVSGAEMKRTVEKLVSFGTRHTLSSQTDPKRGIGAALDWTQGQFKSFGLPTERPCDIDDRQARADADAGLRHDCHPARHGAAERRRDHPGAHRQPRDRRDELHVRRARRERRRVGTAAVIEAARVLSKHKFPGTIVYAALSGEEQGLLGGKILAQYAKAQGWNVVAVLNNDIIGNSCSSDGFCDDKHVRVLSEGPRSQGQAELAAQTHSLGGENDAPSRNISRYLDSLADRLNIGLDVMQIWRTDRFSRGGDHIPFLELGYPAARISVAVENYDWQHQDLRTESGKVYGDTIDHMDFPYLEKITKLNVAALAAIASAPPPPAPKVEGAVSTDTTVTWTPGPGEHPIRCVWTPDGCAHMGGIRVVVSVRQLSRAAMCPMTDCKASYAHA